MTKRIVELFPDYCSTGLWLVSENDIRSNIHCETVFGDHVNVDPKEVGVSEGLQLAIKYWHEAWEIFADSGDGFGAKASWGYIQRWIEDGRKLAKLLSAENDKYEFVYKQSKYNFEDEDEDNEE